MEKTAYISESCLVTLITSCLEIPHKETGGFLIGKEDARFIMGQRSDSFSLDVAYPVHTSDSGKSYWVPSNANAYKRIKDAIDSMGFQIMGEYHSHIENVPELSNADKKFIKGELEEFQKKGISPPKIEMVLNIEPKAYSRQHNRRCDCTYFKKRVRCNIRGIRNPLTGYSITIGAYQYDESAKDFAEVSVHVP
jgi:hypothetical protein